MVHKTQQQLVGTSLGIKSVLEDVSYAAATDAKVLITGESGVGKEIVAHLLHAGSRREGAFIPVNCAGVPESLLESELFGHARGSFTGAVKDRAGLLELADGGTLFLDEVGEMSLRMQALLLRFLETGEVQRVGGERYTAVHVRLITATNRDLVEQTRAGAFREDLYYRLNVIHITIPPLRERREDVTLLLDHFFSHYARVYGSAPPELSAEMHRRLQNHDWPGNVRELRNLAERLVIRARHRGIVEADLPRELRPAPAPAAVAAASRVEKLYHRVVDDQESFWTAVYDPFMDRDLTREDVRALVTKGLHETRGNYVMLVRLFNLEARDYKRFLNILHKHGCHIPVAPFRAAAVRRPLPGPRTPTAMSA